MSYPKAATKNVNGLAHRTFMKFAKGMADKTMKRVKEQKAWAGIAEQRHKQSKKNGCSASCTI